MANSAAVIGLPSNKNVTEDFTSPFLTAVGFIPISDANPGQAAFKTTVKSATGTLGTLTLAANGAYTYSVANSAVQYLGAGKTKVETFTVTSVDGTSKQVSFTINGTNDAAVIGNPAVSQVTEDVGVSSGNLKATGTLSISDADQGEAAFKTTVTSVGTNLGSLTIAANGAYTYSVSNTAAQSLGANDTKTETFTVTALDGTTKQISFTIQGKNDVAVIGTPTVRNTTDTGGPSLTATGTISVSDADQGQAAFNTTVTSVGANLGALSLNANGSYTYSVTKSSVGYLGAGATKTETFTITSVDGTSKQVSFVITGINDAAVIGTPTVSNVTEDATQPILYAFGSISITDADQGEASFKMALISGQGALGTLVLLPNGSYSYFVAGSAVQYLGAGDTKIDTFTITAKDGTTKQVSFTIHGTNDAAVIGTPTNRDVTADSNQVTLTATGSISISDVDQNQASFNTTVVSAAGNIGGLVLNSNGSYTYTVPESAAAQLGVGGTRVDTFTVTAFDGTTKQVTFVVHGPTTSSNQPAVIGNPTVSAVTEDATMPDLTASGTISISDADGAGQAAFQTTVTSAGGNLGTLSLSSNGSYTYTVANSLSQSLGAGNTKVDTFTIKSLDGTTQQVSFTIHGTNDAAAIGTPAVIDVTEDSNVVGGNLSLTGTLSVSDTDTGQASFQAGSTGAAGNLGALTFGTDGTYTYSVANNATQLLGPNATHVDTFTVKSLDGTSKQLSFNIHGAQDAPTLSVAIASGNEDAAAIPLSISSALVDSGSTLSLTITGVPAGATLNHGAVDAGNSSIWHLSGSDLSGLALTPAPDFSGTFNLSVTATSTDSATSSQLSTVPLTLTVNVAGVADAPALSGPPTISVQASADPIELGLLLAKVDSSETLGSVTISGVGGGYILSSGVQDEDGDWVVPAADIAGLTMLPGTPGLGAVDTLHLHVTATSADGISVAAASIDVVVEVSAPAGYMSGRASDGYISGATVFADANGNGELDIGEISTTTAADGTFTLTGGTGNLVMFGGVDVSTGLEFLGVLSAPNGSTVVTPLTTLVTALVTAADLDPEDPDYEDNLQDAIDAAQLSIAQAFGLNSSIDLQNFDPVAAAAAGGAGAADATAILAAGIQVQTTIAQITAAAGSATTGADVVSAVASAISDAGGSTVNLSNTTTLTSIINEAAPTASTATVNAATQIVSEANAAIVNAASGGGDPLEILTSLAQAATVALGQTTDALTAAAAAVEAGTGDFTAAVANNTGGALTTAILAAEVGDPDGSEIGTSGNDTISGAGGNDVIDGLDGNDTLSGLGGKDTIHGGNGNDTILGGDADDTLYGGDGKDLLSGGTGNDIIDGGSNFDRATYADANGGITVNLLAGTVTGADSGSDAVIDVDGFIGTDHEDHFDGTGFTATAGLPGSIIGFSEFEGGGGDDEIIGGTNALGHALTRVSYLGASAGVTVDLQTGEAFGTVPGDAANVGHDEISNILNVWGSNYDDILRGTNNGAGSFEAYEGRRGNDLIEGRDGYDVAVYASDLTTSAGITVHLADGTVTGDATVGTDTLRQLEAVRGTNFNDLYDATNFGNVGTANIGSLGTFNDFQGGGGNDTVIGNGFTRVNFSSALAGVTVNLQTNLNQPLVTTTNVAGTATGTTEGTDILTGVNAAQGSSFNDTLLGSNFNNTLTGLGGDDVIDGRGGFDTASYNSMTLSTGGIAVMLAAGTVTDNVSNVIGHDTLQSIEAIQGTHFVDTFDATGYGLAGAVNVSNSNFNFNQFEGLGGNDSITGNGNTRLAYNNATAGVTISMLAGTVTGDSSVGSDTFVGVNSVNGSNLNDTYDAVGFTGVTSAGSFGPFNLFEGLGGADTITGNGNTRISYSQASGGGVNVNLATGVVSGAAGADIIMGGVNSVQGSNQSDTITGGSANESFLGGNGNDTINGGGGNDNISGEGGNDTLNGDSGSDTITGGGGNDAINGGAGGDVAIYTSVVGNYTTVNSGMVVSGAATDGTDTLSDVELLQFADTIRLIASGSAGAGNSIDASGVFLSGSAAVTSMTGTDDYLTIGQGFFGHQIDLGAGTADTLTLGVSGGYNLNLLSVENVVGSGGDDFVGMLATVNGLAIDLGASTNGDTVNLASGTNTVSVVNVENLNVNEVGASNDTLTLTNLVSGLSINLGLGINTINLAAGSNSLNHAFGTNIIKGTSSADTLTVVNGLFQSTVDLGEGTDSLILTNPTGFSTLGLVGVENVVGGTAGDYIVLQNAVTGVTFDLGTEIDIDTLNLATGSNSVAVVGVEQINSNEVGAPSDDTLTLLTNVNGITINLGNGSNTLNLWAGTNSVKGYGLTTINGTNSADELTTLENDAGSTIDLGAGTDTLNLGVIATGVTVRNIENVNGSTFNDTIAIANISGSTTVTGGMGTDFITASAGQDNIRYTSAAQAGIGGGETVTNFNAANDTFVLDNVAGLAGEVHFVSGGVFTGSPEARLINGNVLQIDVDGDGQIGAGDMEITLNGLNGTLTSANFVTSGVNHAPTDISLVGTSVAENSTAGTVVGTLSGTDSDAGDTSTFSIVSPNGMFAINGNNLVVAGPIDYEGGATEQVTVRVTDASGATYDEVFNIGITDANDAPTVTSGTTGSVAENAAHSTVVYQATATDPDAGTTIAWSLSGNDAISFTIDSNGQVRLNNSANYEAKSSYSINVIATDGGSLSSSQAVTIGVTDVNEAPVITSAATASVAENAPTLPVYFAAATDPDAGSFPVTWSLTGADAAAFIIDAAGMVRLNSSADYEAQNSYSINVVATELFGGLSSSKAVTVNVTDVNEGPAVTSGATATVVENAASNTVVYQATASDPDTSAPNNAITWSISGTDAGAFNIDTNGQVRLNSSANYEAKNSYILNVVATDGVALSSTKAVTVSITNANEAPTDISVSNATVAQSAANGTIVGALSAIDPDAGDTATFTLVNGASGQFTVDAVGNIVVAGPLTTGVQQVTVRVTDSGALTFDRTIAINVSSGIVGDANANTLTGTSGDDSIQGLGGNDRLQGLAGHDTLDGGVGFDRAVYTDATTSGITVNLAAGTVSGADVGNDTLIGIEGIVGTQFADTYDATAFAGDAFVAGTNIGLNEFEGGGGDDIITSAVNSQGALLTRISYANAASGVVVDLTAHTATGGDGSDTLIGSGFAGVIGSGSVDQLLGSSNAGGTVEVFDGRAGNDLINGMGGFDRADYALDPAAVGGINVQLAAGTVTGDAATVGTDTLRSVESVRGSNNIDIFNASGFGAGSTNGGSNGTFNEFVGMGGNDIITGNGNTRIAFTNATGAVVVDMQTNFPSGTPGPVRLPAMHRPVPTPSPASMP